MIPQALIRHVAVALSFLTRLPMNLTTTPSEDEVASSAAYFGVIGAMIGLCQGSIYWLAVPLSGHLVAAVISVVATVLLTGAFHHDGLADSADALVGGWNREQRIEIMKDSRLGTYGVMSLVLVVVLEVALIAALEVGVALAGLVAAHALSRTTTVLLALTSSERGRGLSALIGSKSTIAGIVTLLASLATTLVGAVWFKPLSPDRLKFSAPTNALLVAAVVLVVFGAAYLLGRYAYRRIGAITGDILGAVERLSFSLFLLGWVVLYATAA